MNPDYAGLVHALQPETHLVVGALLVLFLDMLWAKHRPANRHHVAMALGLIALASAGYQAIEKKATDDAWCIPLIQSVTTIAYKKTLNLTTYQTGYIMPQEYSWKK